MSDIVKFRDVENRIINVRGVNVLLDRDVAELYGVETRRINEAVNRNQEKFPEGYVFEVDETDKLELVANCDRFDKLKHSSTLPKAFTEKGLYMLATILKSPIATQTTIAIVEAFTKLRNFVEIINEVPDIKDEIKQKSLMQRSCEIFASLFESMDATSSETTVEFNVPGVKLKHSVKREKRKDS